MKSKFLDVAAGEAEAEVLFTVTWSWTHLRGSESNVNSINDISIQCK